MRELSQITKALADDNRLRILAALRHGELCVCQVIELLELAPSTVSKHLSILRMAGLLESRKEGRWMHYRLPGPEESTAAVRRAIAFVLDSLRDDQRLVADDARLRQILATDPVEICLRQRIGGCCPPGSDDSDETSASMPTGVCATGEPSSPDAAERPRERNRP